MAPKPGWTGLVLGWVSNPVLIHELDDSGGMSKVVVASLLCSKGFRRVLSFLPSFAFFLPLFLCGQTWVVWWQPAEPLVSLRLGPDVDGCVFFVV